MPEEPGWYWFRPRSLGPLMAEVRPERVSNYTDWEGLWWPVRITPPDTEPRFFESKRFGSLLDNEENRTAARAADVMGWPYAIMTGATMTRPDCMSGLNLVQMSEMKYDGRCADYLDELRRRVDRDLR